MKSHQENFILLFNAYYLIPAMPLGLPFHIYFSIDLKGVPDIYFFSFLFFLISEAYQHLVHPSDLLTSELTDKKHYSSFWLSNKIHKVNFNQAQYQNLLVLKDFHINNYFKHGIISMLKTTRSASSTVILIRLNIHRNIQITIRV